MRDGELASLIEDHDERSEEELRRFLLSKGYDEERIENAFTEAKATIPLYALLLTGIITIFLRIPQAVVLETFWLTTITVYCSVFTYWLLRQGTKKPQRVMKRLIVPTMFLTFAAGAIQLLVSRIQRAGAESMLTFLGPSITTVSLSIAVFFTVPVILTWLDAQATPGFTTHPLTTLVYVVLFNIVYYVYWFHTFKSNISQGDEIASLWLFLLPLIGPLLIYYSTADHLSDHTRHSFTTWFAVFFFLQGIDLPVAQYLLPEEAVRTK